MAWTLFAGSALASPAFAADQPDAAGDQPAVAADEDDAEIVVTALRRAQRLLDVPASISAFTAEDIENRGVTTLNQLQASVPGLRIVDIGTGSQRIQLRGISQYLGLPTVGNYIDEFGVNNEGASGSVEIRLLDMERIEVLRGPQPALYGEGAMGGTIRYVTAAPDLDEFGGNLLGEINSVRNGDMGYRVEGVLNLPLATDVAGIRLAGARETVAGFIDGPAGDDLNGTDITTLRARLLVRPSPDFTVSLLGLYQDTEQDFKNYSRRDRTTAQSVATASEQRYFIGNLVLTYDLGPVTLLSSTGYLHSDGRSVDDSGPFYNRFIFNAPVLQSAISDSTGEFERWAQEVRLTSNGSGPFRYLLGASYSEASGSGDAIGNSVPAIPGVVFAQVFSAESKVWAVFGSVSYDLTDWLMVDVGGRYFNDERSSDSTLTLPGLGIPPIVSSASGTFNTFNPRVNVSARTSANGIIYANAAKGFRSGGFNAAGSPQPTFEPEELWSYELGTRQGFFDNQLIVEAAVYYNDYTNIQAVIVVPGSVRPVTTNSGNADGFGFDLSLTARPDPDLSISATLGYNNLRYNTNSVDRFAGDPPDLVPQWSWSASVDYSPQLSPTVELIAHADIGFTDEGRITLRNLIDPGTQLAEIVFSESRAVANAQLGASFSNFEVYAFARNLLDENRIVNPAFGGFVEPIFTRPRTIGLGARARF